MFPCYSIYLLYYLLYSPSALSEAPAMLLDKKKENVLKWFIWQIFVFICPNCMVAQRPTEPILE